MELKGWSNKRSLLMIS